MNYLNGIVFMCHRLKQVIHDFEIDLVAVSYAMQTDDSTDLRANALMLIIINVNH